MLKRLIPFLIFALAVFSQDMSDISKITQEKSSGLNVRGQSSDLKKLLEEKKDRTDTELGKIGDYIPIEGSIVDSLYIVGPHDKIAVMYITPDSDEENRLDMIVNPDGEVIIPSYGAAYIGGLTFKEAREVIKEKVRTIVNVSRITVNLIETRIFRAHITGYVLLPGAYNLSSSHRLSDIIDFAGGPSPSGDLSSIKIYRDNDTLVVDLYRYLRYGELAGNPYLQDGDVVNIGPVLSGSKVYFSGAVTKNGYYSLGHGNTLGDFLPAIVDPAQNSDLSRIKILRDEDEMLMDLESNCDFTLKPGDHVVVPVLQDSVIVGGYVQTGGSFPFRPHATYKTYVAMAGGPAEKGSIGRVVVFRDGKKISNRSTILPGDVIIVKRSLFNGTLDVWTLLAQIATVALTIYTIGKD